MAFIQMDIYAPKWIKVILNLNPDWELISLPIQPAESIAIADVLSSIDGNYNSVWRYKSEPDPQNSTWLWYLPDFIIGSNLDEMEAGIGYWLEVTASDSLEVKGLPPGTVIHLFDEWNLVGCNSRVPVTSVH